MTYANICKSVQKLKKQYGENDPFRLCRAMGIILLMQPLGIHTTAIKGFYMKCKRIRSITVNSDLPKAVQRIIIAHELGHATIHQEEGIHAFHEITLFDRTSGLEREANLFAAELLLDDHAVLDALRQSSTFFHASSELMVPAEILDFKLRLMKWKGYELAQIPIQSRSNFMRQMETPNNTDDYC